MSLDPKSALTVLNDLTPLRTFGKVRKIVGMILEGQGIKAPLGAVCSLLDDDGNESIHAEVVGFRDDAVLFMPYGDMRGVKPGTLIQNTNNSPLYPIGPGLLGRTLDAFGAPLDNKDEINPIGYYPLYTDPPPPLGRPRISEPLDVGVRAINGLLTLGKGQRVGIMAGSGVGKSTLMGMMARYTKADVNVIALVGERGREVLEFMEKDLGPEGLARSVLIVATSDQSPLVRMRAAFAATAVAEFFRDQGQDVLLMMDSVTRFAMAAREVGLAVGEPPTSRGYTPSVFAQLPKLLERAGRSDKGTITGVYTVLVDGDDFNEPIADATRSILDGHLVLTRELADQGHYPCIDVLKSISRLRNDIAPEQVLKAGTEAVRLMATYNRVEDMVNIGAYSQGSNPEIDKALAMMDPIRNYLQQPIARQAPLKESYIDLVSLIMPELLGPEHQPTSAGQNPDQAQQAQPQQAQPQQAQPQQAQPQKVQPQQAQPQQAQPQQAQPQQAQPQQAQPQQAQPQQAQPQQAQPQQAQPQPEQPPQPS